MICCFFVKSSTGWKCCYPCFRRLCTEFAGLSAPQSSYAVQRWRQRGWIPERSVCICTQPLRWKKTKRCSGYRLWFGIQTAGEFSKCTQGRCRTQYRLAQTTISQRNLVRVFRFFMESISGTVDDLCGCNWARSQSGCICWGFAGTQGIKIFCFQHTRPKPGYITLEVWSTQ